MAESRILDAITRQAIGIALWLTVLAAIPFIAALIALGLIAGLLYGALWVLEQGTARPATASGPEAAPTSCSNSPLTAPTTIAPPPRHT